MADAMVTGRMSEKKKRAGVAVLEQAGMTASEAINLLFDRLIEDQDASFLRNSSNADSEDWQDAAIYIDGLSRKRNSRYHNMTKGQIKLERYMSKGE